MKLCLITLIVLVSFRSAWTQDKPVTVAQNVQEDSQKTGNPPDGKEEKKPEKAKDAGEKKPVKIDDHSLPSLNLFPLLDPSMTDKLPPLPVGGHATPAKRIINGRLVITRVPRPAKSRKPALKMRKINGKWVIGLK